MLLYQPLIIDLCSRKCYVTTAKKAAINHYVLQLAIIQFLTVKEMAL